MSELKGNQEPDGSPPPRGRWSRSSCPCATGAGSSRQPRLDPRADVRASRSDRHGRRVDGRDTCGARVVRRRCVVRQEQARGIYDNANDGIDLARGEYVAVYHADDVYLPTSSSDRWRRSSASLSGAIFAFVSFIDVDGSELGRLGPAPAEIVSGVPLDYEVVLNGLLRHKNCFLATPSALVPTNVYDGWACSGRTSTRTRPTWRCGCGSPAATL